MNNNPKVELIKNLYANFGRGNIDGILSALADDVRWEEPATPGVPYGGERQGKPAVRDFFAGVGQVEVASFEPQEYVVSGDRVLVIGRWSGKVKTTGKSFLSEWVMSWIVKDGKVTHFRAYEDTAALAAAFGT
jgi:ketosteroid isomerase-like protein